MSLAIAAVAMVAAVAPSGAFARSQHRAHAAVSRAAPADGQGWRAYGAGTTNAYGAMQGGSSSGSAGFGYGVGDNSHGCSACTN